MKVGSTFTGCGLLDLGITRAGLGDVVWHVELDRHASTVLDARWPGVPNLGDVTKVEWGRVEPVDVLIGGPPCQPVSQAGQRKGPDDERWLWPAWLDAVRLLRPRLLVAENPPGFAPWLGWLLCRLAERGYVGSWLRLRASDLGGCHRRERIFVIAVDSGHGPGSAEHGQPSHVTSERVGQPSEVATADTDGEQLRVGAGRLAGTAPAGDGEGPERQRVRAHVGDGCTDAPADAYRSSGRPRDAEPGDSAPQAGGRGTPGPGGRDCATPDADGHGRGGEQGTSAGRVGLLTDKWDDAHRRGDAPADAAHVGRERGGSPRGRRDGSTDSGALAPDTDNLRCERPVAQPLGHDLGSDPGTWGPYEPAITRWASYHGTPPQPVDRRGRLNPAFVEWMMGAPAGWVTDLDLPRSAMLRMLGNGVFVPCAEMVARLAMGEAAA